MFGLNQRRDNSSLILFRTQTPLWDKSNHASKTHPKKGPNEVNYVINNCSGLTSEPVNEYELIQFTLILKKANN